MTTDRQHVHRIVLQPPGPGVPKPIRSARVSGSKDERGASGGLFGSVEGFG
jgi:hypothetical protein